MRVLEARISAIRYQMEQGRGGESPNPQPLALEPPFAQFTHELLRSGAGRHQAYPAPDTEIPAPSAELRFLRVRLSADDEYSLGRAEQLLLALSPRHPLAFEALGRSGSIAIQLVANADDVENCSRQISSHYPRARISSQDDLLAQWNHPVLLVRSYRLRQSHLFRIRVQHVAETYAALTGMLSGLGNGQTALIQVLFKPVRHPWRDNILRVASDPWDPGKSAFLDLPDLPRKAQAKVEKPLLAVAVRLAASDQRLLEKLEGCFLSQFESEENALIPCGPSYPPGTIFGRYTLTAGMLLNAQELSSLVHLPDPKVLASGAVEVAVPTALAPQTAVNQLVHLGTNRHQNRDTPVGISANWLTRHCAIFGATGYGKTTLLKRFVLPLMEQGYGFAFLDPAGDAAEEMLHLVPESRTGDVVYFNPGDREYPPGLNVLQSSRQDQEMLAAELMVGLKRIFRGHSEFGPRMEWITRQAIRTLLASEGEKTLRDVPRLLADDGYREEVLKTVADPDLQWFWRSRSPLTANVIDPVLSRLSAFLDRPTVRNIVAQPNLIDFHQIMRESRILICNLSKGLLGEEHSALLGSFILCKLQLATMARAEVPVSERKIFCILVDEFQNYAASGMDTSSIRSFLSEARKYGAALVTATQFTSQLDRDVITAIFGSVGTMICLRCGVADAQMLQRELGTFKADDLLNLETGQALVRMGRAASTFNVDIAAPSLPGHSFRDQIVQMSRDRYCRRRTDVESSMEGKVQDEQPRTEVLQRDLVKPDEIAFLERAARHPEDTITTVCADLGLSGSRAARIRNVLSERGLLIEIDTRLGEKGRRAKYAIPTLEGYRLLGEKPPPGRGGPVHKHFADVIGRWARQKGYDVLSEHQVPGGWVDLHLERDGQQTAVEISITSTVEREAGNLGKCLEAGYSQVVMLFLDGALSAGFLDHVQGNLGDEGRKKVVVGSLDDFHRLL